MTSKTAIETVVREQICRILERPTDDPGVAGLAPFVNHQLDLIRDALYAADCSDEPVKEAIFSASMNTCELCDQVDSLAEIFATDWDPTLIDPFMAAIEAAADAAHDALQELLDRIKACATPLHAQADLAATAGAQRQLDTAVVLIEELQRLYTGLPQALRAYLENEAVAAAGDTSFIAEEPEFAL